MTGRRIAVNFGWLLGGRGGAAIITLAATILTARALGAGGFGTVVLVHTAALVIRQLSNIKTAEAVVRFGVPLREAGREAQWRRLLAATFRLDLVTAAVGAAAALLVNLAAAGFFDLAADLQTAAWAYVIALAFSAAGTAKGALRVMDRYVLLSGQLMVGPLFRLAGVVLAVSLDAPVYWYVLLWAGALMVEHLAALISGWWVLRPDIRAARSVRLRRVFREEPRLGGFLKVVYWQSNLDVFPRQVTTLLVGGYFGAEGAGVFRLARDLAEVIGKPVALLRQAIFPDLSRLWPHDEKRFMQVTARVSLSMLAVGGVFVVAALLAGEPLLAALAGEEYRAGAAVLALLLGAATLELGGAALRPASYTLGHEVAVLKIQVAATLVYFAVFFSLAGALGIAAAGWAALAMSATTLAALARLVHRAVRRAAVGPSNAPGSLDRG